MILTLQSQSGLQQLAGRARSGLSPHAVVSGGPSAYSISPELAGLLPDWHGRTALFTYYAFAQVMTIGYSDVTPVQRSSASAKRRPTNDRLN